MAGNLIRRQTRFTKNSRRLKSILSRSTSGEISPSDLRVCVVFMPLSSNPAAWQLVVFQGPAFCSGEPRTTPLAGPLPSSGGRHLSRFPRQRRPTCPSTMQTTSSAHGPQSPTVHLRSAVTPAPTHPHHPTRGGICMAYLTIESGRGD